MTGALHEVHGDTRYTRHTVTQAQREVHVGATRVTREATMTRAANATCHVSQRRVILFLV